MTIFVPVKPWMKFDDSSERVYEMGPWTPGPSDSESSDTGMISKSDLKQEIASDKTKYNRAITQEEYDKYLEALKTTQDAQGSELFNYELSALARVMFEVISAFTPSMSIDPIIETRIMEATELDPVFRDKYYETLEEYRTKLNTAPLVSTPVKPVEAGKEKAKYVHPMLKYGLIKKR